MSILMGQAVSRERKGGASGGMTSKNLLAAA
jgi:hypothetical protein